MKTDVAIIGAGPAGSTLAILLALRGVDVVLIDRDQFPRDKLCGEFLSHDTLPLLDGLGLTGALDSANAPHVDRCRVVGRSRDYEFDFPHRARGVSRLLFDDLLCRTAVARGVRSYIGWTATSIAPDRVELQRDGQRQCVAARVVVGAWGRWGRFDVQLGRKFVRERTHRSFGFKRHYRGGRGTPNTIELYSFDRGYLGVSRIEGGLTNICGLVRAERLEQHRGRWPAFVAALQGGEPRLAALYGSLEPAQEEFLSSEPVIFRARSVVERGVFMIGDASGIVDPLAGNGIAMAMQSALIVAPNIISALAGELRERVEERYRLQHRRLFARRISWSRRAAVLLSHPRLLDAAMASVRSKRGGVFLLERTRADAREIDRLVLQYFQHVSPS